MSRKIITLFFTVGLIDDFLTLGIRTNDSLSLNYQFRPQTRIQVINRHTFFEAYYYKRLTVQKLEIVNEFLRIFFKAYNNQKLRFYNYSVRKTNKFEK